MAIATRPVIAVVERTLGVASTRDDPVTLAVVSVLQALLIFIAFSLVDAVVPLGERMWRAVLIAAAAVTVLFLATRAAFTAIVGLL